MVQNSNLLLEDLKLLADCFEDKVTKNIPLKITSYVFLRMLFHDY